MSVSDPTESQPQPELHASRLVELLHEAELQLAIQASASRILGLALADDPAERDPEIAWEEER